MLPDKVHYLSTHNGAPRRLEVNYHALAIALPITLVVVLAITMGVFCFCRKKRRMKEAEEEPPVKVEIHVPPPAPPVSVDDDKWYISDIPRPPPTAPQYSTDTSDPVDSLPSDAFPSGSSYPSGSGDWGRGAASPPNHMLNQVTEGGWGPARTVKPSKVVIKKPPPQPQLPITLPRQHKETKCHQCPDPDKVPIHVEQLIINNGPVIDAAPGLDAYEEWCRANAAGAPGPVSHSAVPKDSRPPQFLKPPLPPKAKKNQEVAVAQKSSETASGKSSAASSVPDSPNFGPATFALVGDSFAATPMLSPIAIATPMEQNTPYEKEATPVASSSDDSSKASKNRKNRFTFGGETKKAPQKGRLSLMPAKKASESPTDTESLGKESSKGRKNLATKALSDGDKKSDGSPNDSPSDVFKGWWDRITNRFSMTNSTEALPSASVAGGNIDSKKPKNTHLSRRASAEFRPHITPRKSQPGPVDFDITDSVDSAPATSRVGLPPVRKPTEKEARKSLAKAKIREQLHAQKRPNPPATLMHSKMSVIAADEEEIVMGSPVHSSAPSPKNLPNLKDPLPKDPLPKDPFPKDPLENSRVALPFGEDSLSYDSDDPICTPQPQRFFHRSSAPPAIIADENTAPPTHIINVPEGENCVELKIQLTPSSKQTVTLGEGEELLVQGGRKSVPPTMKPLQKPLNQKPLQKPLQPLKSQMGDRRSLGK
eukprot:Platyproteum_vivax@DN5253_c0_g1_i1.p1